ncbi:transketolase C-terminal domain-containing protein [Nannocystis pusilla]
MSRARRRSSRATTRRSTSSAAWRRSNVEELVAAAAKTGKLVIAHAGGLSFGPGAELAAIFADRAILHLDAPIVRVAGREGPLARADEMSGLPSVAALVDAIHRVVTY